ncbi:MAG: hypothetical protein J7K73_01625 [Nanoarchaeota archaeon]|nr:hypothetical protein [Nanoarchaeota archaeon]
MRYHSHIFYGDKKIHEGIVKELSELEHSLKDRLRCAKIKFYGVSLAARWLENVLPKEKSSYIPRVALYYIFERAHDRKIPILLRSESVSEFRAPTSRDLKIVKSVLEIDKVRGWKSIITRMEKIGKDIVSTSSGESFDKVVDHWIKGTIPM